MKRWIRTVIVVGAVAIWTSRSGSAEPSAVNAEDVPRRVKVLWQI